MNPAVPFTLINCCLFLLAVVKLTEIINKVYPK